MLESAGLFPSKAVVVVAAPALVSVSDATGVASVTGRSEPMPLTHHNRPQTADVYEDDDHDVDNDDLAVDHAGYILEDREVVVELDLVVDDRNRPDAGPGHFSNEGRGECDSIRFGDRHRHRFRHRLRHHHL